MAAVIDALLPEAAADLAFPVVPGLPRIACDARYRHGLVAATGLSASGVRTTRAGKQLLVPG